MQVTARRRHSIVHPWSRYSETCIEDVAATVVTFKAIVHPWSRYSETCIEDVAATVVTFEPIALETRQANNYYIFISFSPCCDQHNINGDVRAYSGLRHGRDDAQRNGRRSTHCLRRCHIPRSRLSSTPSPPS